jgi:CelD/BcsL family acetyltransferase involved in cellulose biosynthesis
LDDGRHGLRYEILDDGVAVRGIAAGWDRLLVRSSCNRAFGSATWFLATCRLEQAAPHLVVARRGAELVGVLPLLRAEGGALGFSGALTDYNDAVVAGDEVGVAAGLLRAALAIPGGSTPPELRNVREDATCLRAARSLGLEAALLAPRICQFVRLPPSHAVYLETRSPRFRKTLRNVCNRAARAGAEVRLLEPDRWPPDRLAAVFEEHQLARFGARSCFGPEARRAFLAEVLPALFAERRLLPFALFVEGRMLALDLCLAGARSLCVYNGGFLPEAEPLSPGWLFFDAEIRYALSRGLAELDLLRGEQRYKAAWATGTRTLGCLSVAAPPERAP